MKKLISIVLALCLMLPCLAIADGAADGAYSAVCKGFYGDFNVTVTIAGGKIADIAWEGSMETPELGGKAAETLAAQLTQTGSTAGVDAITGSTMTSEAIFTAMDACLAQAQ